MDFAVNSVRIIFHPKLELNFQMHIKRIRKKTSIVKEELDTAHMRYVQEMGKITMQISEGPMNSQPTVLKNKKERIHYIPHCRNDHFFGRKDILQLIQSELSPCNRAGRLRSIALHALGGQGKTQITLEYTYQHLDEFGAVIWILSNSLEKIEQDFVEIATLLGLERSLGNTNHAKNFVLQWLSDMSIRAGPSA